MPSRGGEPRLLETPVGEKHLPSFSPDGRFIAYYGVEGEGLWYKNQGLWILPAAGSEKPINLTEQYDVHVSSSTINDFGSPELMVPTWSDDGSRIYFPIVLHGSSLLCSISIDGTSFETVAGNGSIIGSFNFDKEHKRLGYFNGTFEDPGQVVVRFSDLGTDRKLTQINQSILSKIDLGNIEETWIKGPDGNDIQGWIIKPPGFKENKSYPSILEIHGGPLTQYGRFFMHEFYFLAANGYVVHFCNPRGGRGYGEEHAKAIWGGWGDADYRDLMSWTDYISEKPYIDPERMGVTGGSYGGYMTVWIIGHTNRFKAAITQRCVSNLISLWGSSDVNWVFQQLLNNKPPFSDLDKYWDHSPIKYIGNANTPTLVIHSENDLRCPIEQGEQVFVALKTLGIETEMVRFPEEFHGLSRTGRTDRRIVRLNHILRWFDKYLKNIPPIVS
jgi:dipeptidyl aminopeptidase/acylaminoacyl peptidase